jgi:hypothetical protein
MARPRKIKSPTRLNLLIGKEYKRSAFQLADHRGLSVGELFEQLVVEELARVVKEVKKHRQILSSGDSNAKHRSQHPE